MSIIEGAAALARPTLYALGANLVVWPGGRGAVIQVGEVLRPHIGMVSNSVELMTYGEVWHTARPTTATELAQRMVAAGERA